MKPFSSTRGSLRIQTSTKNKNVKPLWKFVFRNATENCFELLYHIIPIITVLIQFSLKPKFLARLKWNLVRINLLEFKT